MTEKKMLNYILAVNAGSSSLKLQLFNVTLKSGTLVPNLRVKSSVSNLSSPPAKFTFKNYSGENYDTTDENLDHINSEIEAFQFMLEHLKSEESGVGRGILGEITHVCHRVVHGGEMGEKGPLVVDDGVLKQLEEIVSLAPLHNGPADLILRAALEAFPKATNIAFFDSSFHNSLPDFIRAYPIDQKVAKERKLRKYGFHGLSYSWIVKNVAAFFQKDEKEISVIALHLGNGASMCAIKNGQSYDTTMGLTPLEGLPGGSRSGTMDPSLVFHYSSRPADSDKVSSVELSHAESILNLSSGFKALTGTSDFAEILATDPPSPESTLAIRLFLDRILGFFGSYWLKLNGGRGCVDAVVFSGGIGEGSSVFREMIVKGLGGLDGGFDQLDHENNIKGGGDGDVVYSIGDGGGETRLLVCKTNEELEMVEECLGNKILWPSETTTRVPAVRV
ncbi:hypothetical protein TWF481_000532 [Arthrobotrys musiformis]|uniref:Probable acetate kinase n=1 Tax=Arthrobotrys musiformis TaxID=47236 RepID=A0AAV9WTL4_9PEZI